MQPSSAERGSWWLWRSWWWGPAWWLQLLLRQLPQPPRSLPVPGSLPALTKPTHSLRLRYCPIPPSCRRRRPQSWPITMSTTSTREARSPTTASTRPFEGVESPHRRSCEGVAGSVGTWGCSCSAPHCPAEGGNGSSWRATDRRKQQQLMRMQTKGSLVALSELRLCCTRAALFGLPRINDRCGVSDDGRGRVLGQFSPSRRATGGAGPFDGRTGGACRRGARPGRTSSGGSRGVGGGRAAPSRRAARRSHAR